MASTTLSSLPPAPEIPLAFSASFKSWWASGEKQSAISEQRLLSRLPFFRTNSSTDLPDGPVVAESSRVDLSTPKHYINTVTMRATNPSPSAPPPAVLLHGYGAGLGFFFQNLLSLANWAGKRGTTVYALDWLGMGRSARVPFNVSSKRGNTRTRVQEAESFFIDSLEDWRKTMGLEKLTLIGHSIGGYFSVAYALKYPSRVNRLILLSPAGVPRGPDYTDPEREFTDDEVSGEGPATPASKTKIKDLRSDQKKETEKRKESTTRRLLMYLWEEGYSPFQIARFTTFWAPMLIGKYSSRRFSGLTEEETRDMHDYILNITLAKGSGEYCISHVLSPGAHARWPIVDRIDKLKIPVTFVYGDSDWMDPQGGEQSVEKLRQAGNGQGRMYIVQRAGHHVYLDNPKAVNDLLVKELDRDIRKTP